MPDLVRQSHLFGTPLREPPKDAETVNHRLLVRAGFVDQLMAGVYSYLPLGLRVLKKIEAIVRQEMNAIGGQEILMPSLHPKAIWERTGGWNSIDVLFKIKSRTDKEYALGQSEEEVVTPLVMSRINTYKELPLAVYQIHWKFRDELRSKSGLLRGREFYMKDMYSFHEHQEDFERFYEIVKNAYFRIFERLGLSAKATEASGGSFSEKISYEFMVLSDAGEDVILFCDTCEFCVNADITKQKEGTTCPKCRKGFLKKAKASEVGNVFDLGEKYGKDFDVSFLGRSGKKQYPVMGCYGIGISRLMGILVETFHDEKGILWPAAIAPFALHILEVGGRDGQATRDAAEKLATELSGAGLSVLYDDREGARPGEKFADADLIGVPWRVVVSPKHLANDTVGLKRRTEREERAVRTRDLARTLRETESLAG